MLIEDRTTGLALTFPEFMQRMGGRTAAPANGPPAAGQQGPPNGPPR
jgi:hypothetical protein